MVKRFTLRDAICPHTQKIAHYFKFCLRNTFFFFHICKLGKLSLCFGLGDKFFQQRKLYLNVVGRLRPVQDSKPLHTRRSVVGEGGGEGKFLIYKFKKDSMRVYSKSCGRKKLCAHVLYTTALQGLIRQLHASNSLLKYFMAHSF